MSVETQGFVAEEDKRQKSQDESNNERRVKPPLGGWGSLLRGTKAPDHKKKAFKTPQHLYASTTQQKENSGTLEHWNYETLKPFKPCIKDSKNTSLLHGEPSLFILRHGWFRL